DACRQAAAAVRPPEGRGGWTLIPGGSMSVSDPIADCLTCVRNAVGARHRKVDVPATRMKTELARVLLRERFINNFKVIEDTRQGVLRIYLKYGQDDKSVITGIRRSS